MIITIPISKATYFSLAHPFWLINLLKPKYESLILSHSQLRRSINGTDIKHYFCWSRTSLIENCSKSLTNRLLIVHQGVLPLPENSFEGSYVAVAGRPGERTVHIVNGKTGVEIAGTGEKRLQEQRH